MKKYAPALLLIALLFLVTLLCLGEVLSQGASCPDAYRIYAPIIIGYHTMYQGAGCTYECPDGVAALRLDWAYDWSREPPCYEGVESVPMLWDETQVGLVIGGNSDWLMGFNEPELSTQADITPHDGAILWRQVEQFYPDRKLVSPAASLGWLNEWYSTYQSYYGTAPKLDAVAGHCYGAWSAAQGIAQCRAHADALVQWAQGKGVYEVWITEFAYLPCWPDGAQGTIEFMQGMVEYYKQVDEITRWAWFQVAYYGTEPWSFGPYCNTSLVDIQTGELTPFGMAYLEGY